MTMAEQGEATCEGCDEFDRHGFLEMKRDFREMRRDVTKIRVELVEIRADLRILDNRMVNVEKTLETFATRNEMQLMLQEHALANRKAMYRALGIVTVVLGGLMCILESLN